MTIIGRIFHNELTKTGEPKIGLAPPTYFLGVPRLPQSIEICAPVPKT